MKKRNALILSVSLILGNLGIDQLTKYLARIYLPKGRDVPVVGSLFVLLYSENRGAFLSLGSSLPDLWHLISLIILPAIVIAVMIWFLFFRLDHKPIQVVGLSCIIGGGLGNLIDRIFTTEVTDFMLFRLGPLKTGVLNIADLSITVGCILLFIGLSSKKGESPLEDQS